MKKFSIDNQIQLEHYLQDQKRGIRREFSETMGTCLIATTIDKILMHAENYDWKLFTDSSSIFKIACMTLHHAYMNTLANTAAIKIIENCSGQAMI